MVKQKVPLLFLLRVSPAGAKPDLSELLEPELIAAQGDAVVNVRIEGTADFFNVILPIGVGVIGGAILWSPLYVFTVFPLFEDLKTYTVEGDIVKYVEGKAIPDREQKFEPVIAKFPVKADVLYLKNGTIVRGTIIAEIREAGFLKSVTIRNEKSEYRTYEGSEVQRIGFEQQFDPETGQLLPKPAVRFDPETGLPKK